MIFAGAFEDPGDVRPGESPVADAEAAVPFLRARGFEARVERAAEPELPIAFGVTNVLSRTVPNLRRCVVRPPRPTPVRDGAGA